MWITTMWRCSLQNEDGVLLSYTASRIGSRHTVEVYGSGGNAVFDGADHFSLQIQKKDPEGGYLGAPQCVKVPEEMYLTNENVPRTPFAINFYFEIRQFIDAIEKGTSVDTDLPKRHLYTEANRRAAGVLRPWLQCSH